MDASCERSDTVQYSSYGSWDTKYRVTGSTVMYYINIVLYRTELLSIVISVITVCTTNAQDHEQDIIVYYIYLYSIL